MAIADMPIRTLFILFTLLHVLEIKSEILFIVLALSYVNGGEVAKSKRKITAPRNLRANQPLVRRADWLISGNDQIISLYILTKYQPVACPMDLIPLWPHPKGAPLA